MSETIVDFPKSSPGTVWADRLAAAILSLTDAAREASDRADSDHARYEIWQKWRYDLRGMCRSFNSEEARHIDYLTEQVIELTAWQVKPMVVPRDLLVAPVAPRDPAAG